MPMLDLTESEHLTMTSHQESLAKTRDAASSPVGLEAGVVRLSRLFAIAPSGRCDFASHVDKRAQKQMHAQAVAVRSFDFMDSSASNARSGAGEQVPNAVGACLLLNLPHISGHCYTANVQGGRIFVPHPVPDTLRPGPMNALVAR